MMRNLFHSTKTIQSQNTFHSKCVCEICRCGKHHCPCHTNIPGTFESTFQPRREQPYNYERLPQCYPYDPSVLQSQYQSEFIKHRLPSRQTKSPEPFKSTGPFYATSDYRVNFRKYPLPAKRVKVPPQVIESGRVTEWKSTYNNDFKPHRSGTAEQFRPMVSDGPEVPQPLGTTTYQNSYYPRPLTRQQKCIDPIQRNLYGDEGRVENSTYQVDYKEHQLPHGICPVESLPRRPNMLSNGQSHLTYNAYTQKWV